MTDEQLKALREKWAKLTTGWWRGVAADGIEAVAIIDAALESRAEVVEALHSAHKAREAWADDIRARAPLESTLMVVEKATMEKVKELLRERVRVASHGQNCFSDDNLPDNEKDEEGYALDGCECGKFIIEEVFALLEGVKP